MRFYFRKFGLLLAILVLSAFFCVAGQEAQQAQAQEATADEVPPMIDMTLPDKPITLKVAYDDPTLWPKSSNVPYPEHAYALFFKDYVERMSGGKIKVELFGGGSIGTYRQTLEMVQNGSLDINIGTGSLGSFFEPIQLITIPYVFLSDDVVEEFFDNSSFWAQLMDKMEKQTGFKYLSIGQNGWRHFTNNVREIRKPEDLKGLKFRVMESPVYVKLIESLGASAVPIAWNETYTALQTGVVDGHENGLAPIALGKIYEVQKYLTLDGHVWSEDVMVMNANKFNSLPIAAQQIIKQGAKIGAEADRVAERMVSNIVEYEIIAKHMQVYIPTADEIQRFRELAQPAVIEYLQGKLGKEVVDTFLLEVKKAEARTGWRR